MSAVLLTACGGGVLDPKGPIGDAERSILLNSFVIMLFVVVPVIVLTLAFAWWFRASNTRAKYTPEWVYSGRIEFIVWAIPVLVVLFLGGIAWVGSHDLDPWKPIDSDKPAVEVQVISLDWKWLFIYPEEGVASVNELVVPAATPVHFRLTSATVMNSFFVPQLGSQIYTMAGMESQLHLLAHAPGEFDGLSAQFSGEGFPDMHFKLRAVDAADYSVWLDRTRGTSDRLDMAAYRALSEPGVEKQPRAYGAVEADLFRNVVMQSHTLPDPPPNAGRGARPAPAHSH
ncbi:ubiquinol oxidase subunit II [Dokdonella sp.]|uniref:ubiquinol oxidase subunit II n=1 Tax=Dokdonella sp. TaxID=2291710 RepID=UPI001B1C2203|nr:ubiquinol oxidase subunit II [Dokdonella sp.]MBO9664213.1 ubiquinol oxidase subunit II [Dokdonella sp.]